MLEDCGVEGQSCRDVEGRETVESVGCVIEGVWLSVGGFERHFEGGGGSTSC